MAKGRKVRASRAAQGYVEFSHFPPAVHFDLIRKQAVVIPALSRDRKSGSAGMPRPISYAVFCLNKKSSTLCHYSYSATTVTMYSSPYSTRAIFVKYKLS